MFGTKMEQKVQNKNFVGTLKDPKNAEQKRTKLNRTKSAEQNCSAEQKVQNKNLVGTLKDPKCKY